MLVNFTPRGGYILYNGNVPALGGDSDFFDGSGRCKSGLLVPRPIPRITPSGEPVDWCITMLQSQFAKYSTLGDYPQTPFQAINFSTNYASDAIIPNFLGGTGAPKPLFQIINFSSKYASDAISAH